MNLARIYAADPRIPELIEKARAVRSSAALDPQVNIWVAYSRLKVEMSSLVGWRCGVGGWMQTEEAYNVAIRALSDALGVWP